MFTARAQDEDMRLGKDLGAEEYVIKPFEPKLLLEKIKGLIGE
jgi:DNA-binding response OmpR family regulator